MKIQPHFLKEISTISANITAMRFKGMFKLISSSTVPIVCVKKIGGEIIIIIIIIIKDWTL